MYSPDFKTKSHELPRWYARAFIMRFEVANFNIALCQLSVSRFRKENILYKLNQKSYYVVAITTGMAPEIFQQGG